MLHEPRDGRDALLDGLQGLRRGGEPVLSRSRQQIHGAADETEGKDQDQQRTRSARYVPAVQRLDRARQDQCEEQRERDGHERHVRLVQQKPERSEGERPRGRHRGILRDTPARRAGVADAGSRFLEMWAALDIGSPRRIISPIDERIHAAAPPGRNEVIANLYTSRGGGRGTMFP